MAVDAPTVNRHSLLLGLVVALSPGWTIRIGDIRAAFLNGVQSSRRLFFRQPARGIPGLRPGQLVEILKGVFGLATSPKLWWLKLSTDLLQKTSATTKTNNMAGTMANMTNGVNTVNPSNMTTMTHSPIKSFSMRHSPPPRPSPVRLIPTNPLTINNDSQDKKKPSRTSYKLGYTQKSGRPKDQKSHRSDRGDQLQEGEVYLTNLESSHEMDLFALNHKSRIQAACELPA